MKTPTEFQLNQLMHLYDSKKAHEYYLRNRNLKGRKPGQAEPSPTERPVKNIKDPRVGKTRAEISKGARAKQKKELTEAVRGLEMRLHKLEQLIKKKSHEDASDNRKSKAKKERSAKEQDKPKSAAEKAKASRENEKFRDKHKQSLKNKAKSDASKSGGSSSAKASASGSKHSLSELNTLAKKVRGQIAVAKQKIAAL